MQNAQILILGLKRSGKSSILRVIFHDATPPETLFLETTSSIRTESITSSLIPFSVIDYPEFWNDENSREILKKMQVLLFVIDAQDELLDPLSRLYNIVLSLNSLNSNLKIHVFIHKIDCLSEAYQREIRQDIQQRMSDEFEQAGVSDISIAYHLTSIYDNSVFEAFSLVIQSVIPSLCSFENILDIFCANTSCDKVFLFDPGCKLYFATDSSPVDPLTFDLCSDILDVVIDLTFIYSSEGSQSLNPIDRECTLALSNGYTVLFYQINKFLCLIAIMSGDFNNLRPLLSYNLNLAKEAILEMHQKINSHHKFYSSDLTISVKFAMSINRPLLAIDVDEVLSMTHEAMIKFYNENYNANLELSDFTSYSYWQVWNVSLEESIEITRIFYNSEHFDNVRPVPCAFEVLKALQFKFDLVVVTSRQETIKEKTIQFIERYYPGIFKGVYFGNHYLSEEEKKNLVPKSKSTICQELGAFAIVDDSLAIALECAEIGMDVFLFDLEHSYMWNKTEYHRLPSSIHRVLNWIQVADWLNVRHLALSRENLNSPKQIDENRIIASFVQTKYMTIKHLKKRSMPNFDRIRSRVHVRLSGPLSNIITNQNGNEIKTQLWVEYLCRSHFRHHGGLEKVERGLLVGNFVKSNLVEKEFKRYISEIETEYNEKNNYDLVLTLATEQKDDVINQMDQLYSSKHLNIINKQKKPTYYGFLLNLPAFSGDEEEDIDTWHAELEELLFRKVSVWGSVMNFQVFFLKYEGGQFETDHKFAKLSPDLAPELLYLSFWLQSTN
ncbi:hypothetical protein ROZALSC1DRAFT_27271 [Rozella allomycis CSF55]|uniref:Gtr1/RagA G protein domain-containing protein n=1 Tax=Rozella allomycis (strain CSF55) TaxID=988480 RepID=A0A075AZA2_ROZAC|nr:Gtr1/RagA G protein domain-containing protein [Rozella allomycis CSF55]RKP21318.1 hypothetical protein ROZALSC1DRAFT_27271 [Rozella allomycis CSF55]|eukprot:EPZ35605.1 Gtr1/RagA G protein domain-containing protein [Rozella allomycis CSF55]